jgi:DNA-binding MarR family transcriptional regulator
VPTASRFRAGCAATPEASLFRIVAIPFDAYQALPSPTHRWLLTCLARYSNRAGEAWPTMRQLALDARLSLSTVSRYLKTMADLGVFQRERLGQN